MRVRDGEGREPLDGGGVPREHEMKLIARPEAAAGKEAIEPLHGLLDPIPAHAVRLEQVDEIVALLAGQGHYPVIGGNRRPLALDRDTGRRRRGAGARSLGADARPRRRGPGHQCDHRCRQSPPLQQTTTAVAPFP